MRLYLAKENSIHEPQFHWHFEQPRNYYLFVLYRVDTLVQIDDSYITVPAGSCILFDKTGLQDYRPAAQEDFCHDYLHFDIQDEADHRALAGIPMNTPLHLVSPEKVSLLVAAMDRQLQSASADSDAALSCLVQALLYMVKDALRLSEVPTSQQLHFATLYRLREQIYLYPGRDWSVEEMCRLTHLSNSHLQGLYKGFFQVSCARDVIQARIRMATSLLQYTNLSIRAIAQHCGYNNTEHFIRQFRAHCQDTPLQFRKKMWDTFA